MKIHWMTNAVISLVLLVISYYYFSDFSGQIPSEYKLMVNVVCVPVLLGVIAGLLFRGGLIERLIYVTPIPVITVILLGGDPAKPGLELILIGPLLLFFAIGTAVSYVFSNQVSRLLKKR